MAHLEVGMACRARELVPGTHQLTVVAAVDAVAECRPQLLGNGAMVLDGEVGDAAPRVEPVWCDDRPGGAGRDARLAGTAMSTGALVDGQRQVRQDLAEEEP